MPDIETTFSTMVLRTTHGGPTQSAKMGVQHLFRRITHIALLNHHSGRCNHPNESRFSVAGIARPVRGTAQEGIAISLSKQKTFTSDPHLELPFEDNARFASLVSSDSLQANYCSFRWGQQRSNALLLPDQDHRPIKRRTRPMLGFKTFRCARILLGGIELVHVIKKGQLKGSRSGETPAEQFYSLVK